VGWGWELGVGVTVMVMVMVVVMVTVLVVVMVMLRVRFRAKKETGVEIIVFGTRQEKARQDKTRHRLMTQTFMHIFCLIVHPTKCHCSR
jgi:hypothetical protein